MDADADVYDEPVYQSYKTYLTTQAATSLFRELISDIEYEAQAKYNAKLTKQQNMCMSANSGGIMGQNDLASTFMWAKLKNNKVPTNYASAGLKPNQFVASNDLYGSFCRVRVNVQSDNKDIQDAINKGADWATAYFAAGDSFTCGSWISSSDLEKIAKIVGEDARNNAELSQKENLKWWLAPLGAVASGVGGAYLGAGIANGDVFGKLSGLNSNKNTSNRTPEEWAEVCSNLVTSAKNERSASVSSYVTNAIKAAKGAGVPSDLTNALSTANTNFVTSCTEDEKNGDDAKWTSLVTELEKLENNCERFEGTNAADGNNSSKKTKIAAGVTGGVSAVAGGVLTYFATKSIQQESLDKTQQAAYQQFMDEIGNHIYCYIGGEEAGQYGDVITTSME